MADRADHKRTVRSAFGRAAVSYDSAAGVQREVCQRLAAFARTLPQTVAVNRVVDAGCGTGYGLGLLAQLCPGAAQIALDFAPAMLTQLMAADPAPTPPLPLCADLEALPLADASVDAIWSSLALQWCEPAVTLGEFARALRPGGLAWIATLGPRTLHELRDAFAAVDEADHVIRFHPRDHWTAQAIRAGFDVSATEDAAVFALAPDLRTLLHGIKAIGAQSVGPQRRRQPLGRAAWRQLEARYEAHRRDDGLLSATYDVILLGLRKP